MTAKEYLYQAFTISRLIKAKETRIRDLRDMLERVTVTLSDDKVQSSPKPDPMGEFMATIVDLEAECRSDILRLISCQKEIEAVINTLEQPEHRLILFERYVNLKKWEDVAADNGYSEKHIFKLHGHALAKLKLDTK